MPPIDKDKPALMMDTYSQLPKDIFEQVKKSETGEIQIILVGEESQKMGQRKLNAYNMGFEFLPEYYEFAEQLNIPLAEFRNFNYIQKDFGFRKQKEGEKTIDYEKLDRVWKQVREYENNN